MVIFDSSNSIDRDIGMTKYVNSSDPCLKMKQSNQLRRLKSGAEDVALIEYAYLTGLFSFYEDGHQECCRVRKVRPLRRALKGLRAWVTGQRKDQSPGTRSEIPVVQVDPAFEGLEGGPGSLVKWNPVANVQGTDIWKFLRTMNVPGTHCTHRDIYLLVGIRERSQMINYVFRSHLLCVLVESVGSLVVKALKGRLNSIYNLKLRSV